LEKIFGNCNFDSVLKFAQVLGSLNCLIGTLDFKFYWKF